MSTTKEQEQSELHAKIWKIADALRGAVDGWDFKAYVIVAMFYRFLSENLTDYVNGIQEEYDPNFDYAKYPDEGITDEVREDIVKTKGFFIMPSDLFVNVLARANELSTNMKESNLFTASKSERDEKSERPEDEFLNVRLSEIFKRIENSALGTASESDFKGLFSDFDPNSPKLGAGPSKREERLLNVLNGVAAMNLSHSGNRIDAFGDAYEFLMAMYASNAGKSGGEFFTPQEVSELLAKLAVSGQKQINKAYDPACGSGSLLLKVKTEASRVSKGGVAKGFYGQEINLTTYNLCRINMILHGVPFNKFDIRNGDTLMDPAKEHWDEEPFDVIVSNPPYSIKWKGDDDPILINDPRFSPPGVLAPKSKADLAFVLHSLAWLSERGAAAIVCFPGIMYRGGAEQKIRKYLVTNNFVDCVIQLPGNLFFGTSIATCIMVLKKNKKDDSVLFIDASREFVKVTNNNKLTDDNIAKIVDAYEAREEIGYFARLAPYDEIAENDYNLSVSTYVEQEDTREKIDIVELNAEIARIVKREQELRDAIDKIIAEITL